MHLWKELRAASEGIRGTGKPLSGNLPDIENLQPDLRVLMTVKMWNAMVFSLVFKRISHPFLNKKCQGIFFLLLLVCFLKHSHHDIKEEIQIVPNFTVFWSADCLGPQRVSEASHTKCSTKTLLFSVCSSMAFPKAVRMTVLESTYSAAQALRQAISADSCVSAALGHPFKYGEGKLETLLSNHSVKRNNSVECGMWSVMKSDYCWGIWQPHQTGRHIFMRLSWGKGQQTLSFKCPI